MLGYIPLLLIKAKVAIDTSVRSTRKHYVRRYHEGLTLRLQKRRNSNFSEDSLLKI